MSNPIFLECSDDRGRSYGNPVAQDMGAIGEFRTSIQFQRLGMARDRVFRISFSVDADFALMGAWIVVDSARS